MDRRCSSQIVCKLVAFTSFSKVTGRDLCRSLFFNKVTDCTPATLLKKTPEQVFCFGQFCVIDNPKPSVIRPNKTKIRLSIPNINQDNTNIDPLMKLCTTKVLYISLDGCCTRFDICYFTLYLFWAMNDRSRQSEVSLVKSVLKNAANLQEIAHAKVRFQ